MKTLFISFICLCLLSSFVWADIIYLNNGTWIKGRITQEDKDSLLIETETEWKRIYKKDISIISKDKQPIEKKDDFINMKKQFEKQLSFKSSSSSVDNSGSIVAMVLGTGAVVLGVAVPFGEPKITITETSLDYNEHTYNALNYILIGAGIISFVAGVATIKTEKTADKYSNFPIKLAKRNETNYLLFAKKF